VKKMGAQTGEGAVVVQMHAKFLTKNNSKRK